MASLWGGYSNVEGVRRDLDTWKFEPDNLSGLKNALHDFLYSWPDNSTTVNNYMIKCLILAFRLALSCLLQLSIPNK
jgi:hypothetical protein